MNVFIRYTITSALAAGLALATQSCDTPKKPEPKPHLTAKKKAPTGCAGEITSRKYNPDSNDFTITYKDADCSGTRKATITFEQDLNARCDEGGHYPQCLKWYDTQPPGMREPTENP